MKVGIIGGGLAGLTCAYRLKQKNIDSVLIEQEPTVGGRIHYNIGAISRNSIHLHVQALIKELGLDALYTPVSPKIVGLLYGRWLMRAEQTKFIVKYLYPPKARRYFNNLVEKLFSLNFDLENPSPELIELRKISFAEYLKDCPKMVQTFCIDPDMNFAHEPDYNKIAADFGMHILRHGFEILLGKDFIFEENLVPLVNVLEEKIKANQTQVITSATVTSVTQNGNGFNIKFTKENKKVLKEVDRVIFATSPQTSQKLMPAMQIESDVYYNQIKCVLTKGEPKFKQRKVLMGVRNADKSNIAVFATSLPYEHLTICFDPKKDIDFSKVYKKNKYEIIREKTMIGAAPVRPPNAKVPSLKTKVDGAYICGDFYYYALMETSVATAEKVVGMIVKNN